MKERLMNVIKFGFIECNNSHSCISLITRSREICAFDTFLSNQIFMENKLINSGDYAVSLFVALKFVMWN